MDGAFGTYGEKRKACRTFLMKSEQSGRPKRRREYNIKKYL